MEKINRGNVCKSPATAFVLSARGRRNTWKGGIIKQTKYLLYKDHHSALKTKCTGRVSKKEIHYEHFPNRSQVIPSRERFSEYNDPRPLRGIPGSLVYGLR